MEKIHYIPTENTFVHLRGETEQILSSIAECEPSKLDESQLNQLDHNLEATLDHPSLDRTTVHKLASLALSAFGRVPQSETLPRPEVDRLMRITYGQKHPSFARTKSQIQNWYLTRLEPSSTEEADMFNDLPEDIQAALDDMHDKNMPPHENDTETPPEVYFLEQLRSSKKPKGEIIKMILSHHKKHDTTE